MLSYMKRANGPNLKIFLFLLLLLRTGTHCVLVLAIDLGAKILMFSDVLYVGGVEQARPGKKITGQK